MSGSIRAFAYTDDRANVWALVADESNTEQLGTSAPPLPGADKLPRNIKPRYARYVSADGFTTRICYALTPTILANVPGFITADSGVVCFLRAVVGERRSSVSIGDTGLNDGDDP